MQSGSLPADQRRLADPSTESARKNVEKEKQQYMSQICEVILSQISKKKRLISGNGGQGGRSDPKKLLQNFWIFGKSATSFLKREGGAGGASKAVWIFFPKIHQILGIQSSLIYLISNLSTYDNHYRFLHGQAQRNRAPGSPKQFNRSA